MRHLLAGRSEAFEGQVFKLAAGATLRYRPLRARVPIMLGTWGPQTARLAGEVADEIKIGGSANPQMAGHLRPHIEAGLAAAGRRTGAVGICLGAVTVVDEDREAARALARREVALYLPVVAPLDPTVTDRDWLERITAAAARRRLRRPSSATSRTRCWTASPSPAARTTSCARSRGSAQAAPPASSSARPHGIDSTRGIKLLGERVLPALRG